MFLHNTMTSYSINMNSQLLLEELSFCPKTGKDFTRPMLSCSPVLDCSGLSILKYLRIRWNHGSHHSPNLQSTKSEVCNCKLIRINNQVLLE